MKRLVLPLLCCLFSLSSTAQKELILRKNEGNFYLEHKVVPKESFYSIGRLYNVTPRQLAQFNKLDLDRGLNVDQRIRIPLTDTNFTMTGNSGAPVYYRAGLNTTLARISDAYRNVAVERLRYWNRRTAEEVAEGEKLIIGFLLNSGIPSVTLNHPPVTPVEEEVVTEKPETVEKTPDEPVVAVNNQEPAPEKTANNTDAVSTEEKKAESAEEGAGFFRQDFELQVACRPAKKNKTVTAGIFKTTSGWENEKYYLLMDEIEPGTIVRLINPTNETVVYAKVLGEMTDIRQNEDLDIRISNAAASKLGISETDKFILRVNY